MPLRLGRGTFWPEMSLFRSAGPHCREEGRRRSVLMDARLRDVETIRTIHPSAPGCGHGGGGRGSCLSAAQRAAAFFSTARPLAYAGEYVSIFRMAAWSKRRSPHSGHTAVLTMHPRYVGTRDLDAVVVLEWKKVLAVIGDDKVRMAFEGARQHGIVFRIVRHGEHLVPTGNNFGDPAKCVHGFHNLVRGVRPIPLHVRARQQVSHFGEDGLACHQCEATGLEYAEQPPAETTRRQQESREDVTVENSPQTALSRAHAVRPGGQRSRRRQSGEGRGLPFASTGAPPPDAAATAASTLSVADEADP